MVDKMGELVHDFVMFNLILMTGTHGKRCGFQFLGINELDAG